MSAQESVLADESSHMLRERFQISEELGELSRQAFEIRTRMSELMVRSGEITAWLREHPDVNTWGVEAHVRGTPEDLVQRGPHLHLVEVEPVT